MKVTSLKDMESYIYSTVILPLKELDVEGFSVRSPMTHPNGKRIDLFVNREETGHLRHEHNFQREEWRNAALHLIWFKMGYDMRVLADYDHRKHKVRVYKPAFSRLQTNLLMNKLIEAFNMYTPFNGVEVLDRTREGYMETNDPITVPNRDEEENYDD